MIVPDYYDKFSCIKGDCKHNCCTHWKIDIDSDTYEYYKSVNGEFGARLDCSINHADTPCFILDNFERCPFLNEQNLCDIIINLGEEHLCEICDQHPRFTNYIGEREEVGLGLCCEAAAKIIITNQSTVKLLGDTDTSDKKVSLRDEIIKILQNRNFKVYERLGQMLCRVGANPPVEDFSHWSRKLLTFEQLDPAWSEILKSVSEDFNTDCLNDFDLFMVDRQTEYEQLAVYFIYRHLISAENQGEISARVAFAFFGVMFIRAVGAHIYSKTGSFDIDAQIELARMFSSEIEYSDENLYKLFELL